MLPLTKNDNTILLIARVLLGAIYAVAIVDLLQGHVPTEFAAKGAILVSLPAAVVWVGYVAKVLAGFCLIAGFKTSYAALFLVIFTLITAFNYHDVGGSIFMKELSMIGGLLLLYVVGPGRISIDNRV